VRTDRQCHCRPPTARRAPCDRRLDSLVSLGDDLAPGREHVGVVRRLFLVGRRHLRVEDRQLRHRGEVTQGGPLVRLEQLLRGHLLALGFRAQLALTNRDERQAQRGRGERN
jgi:hypothetical protein